MSGGIGMKISKNKIMITAIIVLCVAVAVLAAVLVIRKDNREEIVVVQKADPSFQAGRRVRIVGGSSLNVSVIN
jgi:outer membrane lipoprotein SlyB